MLSRYKAKKEENWLVVTTQINAFIDLDQILKWLEAVGLCELKLR
ncbi:hypothetical protein PCARR_a2050 [Pseudoalteromonas carrageenovora IAM 12662]|uniref:Transposase n=1 Tax=Pseudoalteromonas carrageenovora IAM 12662 TaxID=1314868 RepID=A0ABR9ET52_PSEVC|nr:hypothetical protein [Pseudoalteromonas carrageenovora IAM 12662]